MEGLGDIIAWATKKIGIQPCPACKNRQDYLNGLFPFGTSQGRMLKDGTLVFPIRGSAPPEPEGYERTKNPYVFKLKIEPCPYRDYITEGSACCGLQNQMVCHKYRQKTDCLNCRNCHEHGGDL